MAGLKGDTENIDAGRLASGFKEIVTKLHTKLNENNIPLSGNMMVLDSYDGARHTESKKKTESHILQLTTLWTMHSRQ